MKRILLAGTTWETLWLVSCLRLYIIIIGEVMHSQLAVKDLREEERVLKVV
jgi:hypothetical protein